MHKGGYVRKWRMRGCLNIETSKFGELVCLHIFRSMYWKIAKFITYSNRSLLYTSKAPNQQRNYNA